MKDQNLKELKEIIHSLKNPEKINLPAFILKDTREYNGWDDSFRIDQIYERTEHEDDFEYADANDLIKEFITNNYPNHEFNEWELRGFTDDRCDTLTIRITDNHYHITYIENAY